MISSYQIKNETTVEMYLKTRGLSSKNIYKLINLNAITYNNQICKKDTKINSQYILYINYSLLEDNTQQTSEKFDDKYMDILYEDDEIIVIDKKQNILVHSDGNNIHTLLNMLVDYLKQKYDDSYLRCVHRIDVETKGLCVFSKNILSYVDIEKQLELCKTVKIYHALVKGSIQNQTVTINISRDRHVNNKYIVTKNGKEATTEIKKLKQIKDNSLIECKIKEGRTHQIRLTLSFLKHPIIGDKLYGNSNKGLKLISKKITFCLDEIPYSFISNIKIEG